MMYIILYIREFSLLAKLSSRHRRTQAFPSYAGRRTGSARFAVSWSCRVRQVPSRRVGRFDSLVATLLRESRTGSNDLVRAMHVSHAETTTAASPSGHWTPRAAVPVGGRVIAGRGTRGLYGGEKSDDRGLLVRPLHVPARAHRDRGLSSIRPR